MMQVQVFILMHNNSALHQVGLVTNWSQVSRAHLFPNLFMVFIDPIYLRR